MDHNHFPDITQIEVKKTGNEIKINAKYTSNSIHAVIGTLASQIIHAFYKNKINYLLTLFNLIHADEKNLGTYFFRTSRTNSF